MNELHDLQIIGIIIIIATVAVVVIMLMVFRFFNPPKSQVQILFEKHFPTGSKQHTEMVKNAIRKNIQSNKKQ